MCRGKKRLGEPAAAAIADRQGTVMYQCQALCRQFHTGHPVTHHDQLMAIAQATTQALRADPRVGWQGLLELADAWAPDHTRRTGTYLRSGELDQRLAYHPRSPTAVSSPAVAAPPAPISGPENPSRGSTYEQQVPGRHGRLRRNS